MPKPHQIVDTIRIIPLGGLDQFGMNCCLLEFNRTLILVDCGLAFPDETTPGVDYILPDWQWLLQPQNLKRLEAIFITHGHEDHLGGLPFLLEELNVPIYTGKLTARMLHAKLEERNNKTQYQIIECQPADILDFDAFLVEFIHVNHSIPDTMALAFHTSLGYLIFTGDWKLDQTPLYEPVMDLHRFAEMGQQGVLALLGDSTNALTSSALSRSEYEVRLGLNDIIEHAPGRVIVAQFSSNVYRVFSVIELAAKYHKKVAILGRSIERNFNFAQEQGFLPNIDPQIIIPAKEIESHNPKDLVVIMTGTQAEPRASLPRYAFNNHNDIRATPNDTVALCARFIPGNETGIFRMLNQLARQDVTVITPNDAKIHASGHARPEELKLLISLTNPKYVIPMHGDYRIRKAHGQLAEKLGSTPILINDGDTLQLTKNGFKRLPPVPHGKVAVDGKTMNEVADTQWRDRVKLADSGVVVAIMGVSSSNGKITVPPILLQKGFLSTELNIDELLEAAAKDTLEQILEMPNQAHLDKANLAETLRITVRRYFNKTIGRKPLVIPFIYMS